MVSYIYENKQELVEELLKMAKEARARTLDGPVTLQLREAFAYEQAAHLIQNSFLDDPSGFANT